MKRLALAVALAIVAAPLAASAQVAVTPAADQQALLQDKDPRLAHNKRMVFDFWREVIQAGHVELAEKYMAESYIQHNPQVPTGRAPFMKFFGSRPPRDIKPTIDNLVSMVADHDLVVLAFVRTLPDPADATKTYTTTWFDMLRIDNGKIAEHWDVAMKGQVLPSRAPAPAAAQ